MQLRKVINCPICSGALQPNDTPKLSFAFRPQDASHSNVKVGHNWDGAELKTRLMRCSKCGHVVAEEYPTQDEMNRIYEDPTRYTAYNHVVEGEYRYQFGRARNTIKFLKWWIPEVRCHLDIGAGGGALMHRIHKTYKCATYGIEPSNEGNLAARIGPTVADLGQIEGQFDLITLTHVLEHVLDPVNFLGELRDRLWDYGHMYIEVPNQRPLHLTAWHPHYFNCLSLRATIYAAGCCEKAYWEHPWPSSLTPPGVFPQNIGILVKPWTVNVAGIKNQKTLHRGISSYNASRDPKPINMPK